jgi:hypothetical protein
MVIPTRPDDAAFGYQTFEALSARHPARATSLAAIPRATSTPAADDHLRAA